MFTYWIATGVLFLLTAFFVILGIWAIAKTDTFFCFIQEGQGIIIKRGESFHRIIISYHGHHCVIVQEEVGEGVNKKMVRRWKIIPKKPDELEHSNGFIGFLEKRLGVYWIGVYPFLKVMTYQFKWNEWEQKSEKSGGTIPILKHREEPTKFFYVQTFNYALFLSGAETGGKKGGRKNTGVNISVDAQITLLLRIIYPQVAILQNQDWFEQLEAVVLDHARLYVGSRTFEQLHTSVHPESGEETRNEFCEHIMSLNEHAPIGADTDSIVDAFGVEIIGAVIMSIELSGDSKDILKATTAIYEAEQAAEAKKIAANAMAFEIKAKGDADAHAIKVRTQTVADFGEIGMYVEHCRAIIEASKSGTTIVFTNDSEHDEKNKILASLLVDAKGRKIK